MNNYRANIARLGRNDRGKVTVKLRDVIAGLPPERRAGIYERTAELIEHERTLRTAGEIERERRARKNKERSDAVD